MLAIAVMLAGTLAVTTLPVAQYSEIAPPAVTISAEYPGASAEVVENSVIQIIEQAMTGLDNFQHIYSQISSTGWGPFALVVRRGTPLAPSVIPVMECFANMYEVAGAEERLRHLIV